MIDKVLKKQLEAFGTESVRVSTGDEPPQRPKEYSDTILAFVRNSMETMEGREFFYFLLNLCGVFATPYVPEHPNDTAFQCGMQEIGHHIQRLAQLMGDKYFLMAQEAAAKQIRALPTKPQHQSA